MACVFISHSSRDNAAAAELKAWLDSQRFSAAFLDIDKHSGIPPGANWERTLYEQIERCQALVILQTPNWSASKWCFAEFTQARALGKAVFQVVQNDEGAAECPIAQDLQRLDLRQDRVAGLEQLRRELERIALQDQGGFAWPPPNDPNRPPFPGLMVFEAEDAPVFFGRDNEWRAVNERLNTCRVQGGARLLVLLGASGSGKSSLLRAGVLPRLRLAWRQWLVLPVMRPQTRPLESLAQTLALALKRSEAWGELHQEMLATTNLEALAGLVSGWAADLRMANAAPEAQLLLPIDQAEELFTVAEPTERERFVAVLSAALQPHIPLQALMTIRADAMDGLQTFHGLVNSLETFPLGPLSPERYREIIEGPARVARLTAKEDFVSRAIEDTATEDALPLLAFALRQLHERFGGDGVLSLHDYEALGDPIGGLSPLENAVKQAADGVLKAQRPDEASLKALREAFVPSMVRVSEQGNYARRSAVWDALPQAARPLLEALVAARLLVRRQGEGQPSTVEVAHEAMLRVWPLLRGWLDDSREFLLGSQQLEQDLAQWKAASPVDKPRALLSGLKLAKSLAWLNERGDQLRPELRTFIVASQQCAARQRHLLIGVSAMAFAVISGIAGLAIFQLKRAESALQRQKDLEIFQGRLLNVASQRSVPTPPYAIDTLVKRYEGNEPETRFTDFQENNIYYGVYSIKAGASMNDYLGFLERRYPDLFRAFPGPAGDAKIVGKDRAFAAAWTRLAKNPLMKDRFIRSQREYIESRDYTQLATRLAGTPFARPSGGLYYLKANERSLALRSVFFSIAVQYGPETTLVRDALAQLIDPFSASDEEIIKIIYRQRNNTEKYFPELRKQSPGYARFNELRNELELRDALYMLHYSRG